MNGKLKASTIAVMAVGVTGLALINNKVRRFDTITRNSSKSNLKSGGSNNFAKGNMKSGGSNNLQRNKCNTAGLKSSNIRNDRYLKNYRNTERNKNKINSKGIYYSSGNYEAFARPEKPKGIEKKSAYIVGSGLGSLAAACFLVRDAQMPGKNITILENGHSWWCV